METDFLKITKIEEAWLRGLRVVPNQLAAVELSPNSKIIYFCTIDDISLKNPPSTLRIIIFDTDKFQYIGRVHSTELKRGQMTKKTKSCSLRINRFSTQNGEFLLTLTGAGKLCIYKIHSEEPSTFKISKCDAVLNLQTNCPCSKGVWTWS